MARRSLLSSKKRSSKATIAKKRKADKELRQADSVKRTRPSKSEEEEEEIGDFIVVDTGTLYVPTQITRNFTSYEEDSTSPKLSPVTTEISTPPGNERFLPWTRRIEEDSEDEVIVETTPKPTSPFLGGEPVAIDEDQLVIPLFTGDTEITKSQEQSLVLLESDLSSGSQNDPIILSPLSIIEDEAPQGPHRQSVTNQLNSSVDSPVESPIEVDAHVPQTYEETETRRTSLSLSSDASDGQQLLTTDDSIVRHYVPITAEANKPDISISSASLSHDNSTPRKFGNAPLRVLVTRGDQCPSKFVVSGNASHSETDDQEASQKEKVREAFTRFETVTKVRDDDPLRIPLHKSQPGEQQNVMDSGLTISQHKYQEYLQSLDILANARDHKQNSPVRAGIDNNNGNTGPSETLRLPSFVQEEPTGTRRPQAILTNTKLPPHENSESRQPSDPASRPTSSTESDLHSGSSLTNPMTDKLDYWWSTELSCSDDKVPSESPSEPPSATKPNLVPITPKAHSRTLTFTAENRAESKLTTAEVQQLIQQFVKDSVVILPQQQSSNPHPAGVVVWQSLQKFHRWYTKENKLDTLLLPRMRSPAITTLRFEFLDVYWQAEKIFYLPRQATWYEFRDLKQCIWDLFWVSAHLKGSGNPKPFRISITPAPDMTDDAKLGHLIAAYSHTTSRDLPPVSYQPYSLSSLDKMTADFRALESSATHHHRVPGNLPTSLVLDSPQITLEVEGTKTPQMLREFLQKSGNTHDNSQPASLHSSPTRPHSHGSSTGQIELLHPPLHRPESNMTAAFQPQRPPTNNAEPRVTLPPIENLIPTQTSDSGSQIRLVSFQNNNFSKVTYLPSPQPSPVTTDIFKNDSLRGRPSRTDSNYTANTARPMFSVPQQKTIAAPPNFPPATQNIRVSSVTQPSAPNIRVTNTAQPAPNIPIAPRPQPQEVEPETTPAIPPSSRPPRETKRFRDAALQMLSNRPAIVLEPYETTGGRKRTFPEISGVIVDKNSEMGLVSITERGYAVQQVNTGQDVFFEQYTELTLKEGQACVIHGSSTVLYYKTRSSPLLRNRERRPLPSAAPASRGGGDGSVKETVTRSPPSGEERLDGAGAAEIKLRLQKDAAGHFTPPHPFSIIHYSELHDFFEWFSEETGRDGALRPEKLQFILKDAMPFAKTLDVYNSWGHFGEKLEVEWRKVREEIVKEYKRAKVFLPDLKEFGVLVVDPGWIENVG